MTFILWSIVAGLLCAVLYVAIARAYIDRLARARARTKPVEYFHAWQTPAPWVDDVKPRKLTLEEQAEKVRERKVKGMVERALEPYERNGRGA